MSALLAFDVGRTVCRAALVSDGARVRTGDVPCTGGVADRDGVARVLAAMSAVTAGWPAPAAAAAGVAGLAAVPQAAGPLARGLRERLGSGTRVLLASDMVTWHAGALGGVPGVVLAAGTGAVALGIGATGHSARVDGWGHLLGDDGSGHAIGRAGLAAALRAHDGRPDGSVALLARLRERHGEPEALPGRVYDAADPAREVAAFARDVLAVAAIGDPVAGRIADRAATDLAESASAAMDRVGDAERGGPRTVACAGGLLDAGPVLTDRLDAALAARSLTRTHPLGDALDGARLLLEDPTVPHHALLAPATGVLR
ncbi:N-acetylglucosamine kinase [Pseudonocardia sp. HH130630-07]|uniref:N-acetylglucosamine kinase n=1 Tax=Pseudonocardia sp. HH130630-07 TaxID=1690815 RepID=UPI00081530CE|nr:BadF/BadG/BcrA/BcrD ATPase family protein [Pseudonocardia sp. HH130630-07]ANY09168.1 hypothetical protein AFB00_26275 [Pseudonocardia sp. HH130630-07]